MRRCARTSADRARTAVQGRRMVCERLRAEGRVELERREQIRNQGGNRKQRGLDGRRNTSGSPGSGAGEHIERNQEVGRAA
jgi:hypothetical protein